MSTPDKETRQVRVAMPGGPADWQTWINCDPADTLEYTAMMALNRALRLAGYQGTRPFYFEPFTVTVSVARPDAPRDPGGAPLSYHAFDVRVTSTLAPQGGV